MTKSVGTERDLETKAKELDRVRITLVTKTCSNVGDLIAEGEGGVSLMSRCTTSFSS